MRTFNKQHGLRVFYSIIGLIAFIFVPYFVGKVIPEAWGYPNTLPSPLFEWFYGVMPIFGFMLLLATLLGLIVLAKYTYEYVFPKDTK